MIISIIYYSIILLLNIIKIILLSSKRQKVLFNIINPNYTIKIVQLSIIISSVKILNKKIIIKSISKIYVYIDYYFNNKNM